MKTTETLIRSGKATVVDVRTYTEFMGAHVKGSMNIPLQDLPNKLEELKKINTIVLCCASGNRSEQARAYLNKTVLNVKMLAHG